MPNRRHFVPFDSFAFERSSRERANHSMYDIFREIHETNHWASEETVSGEGAERKQTAVIEAKLPALFRKYHIHSILDAPCGNFGWISHVDISEVRYIGMDIVAALIQKNKQFIVGDRLRFVAGDMTRDLLPLVDLMLCRDVFVHFGFEGIRKAIHNLKKSHIPWFLTTTFPASEHNEQIVTGDWRPINLQLPPFNFPEPVEMILEGCTEGSGHFTDKTLALWRTEELPDTFDFH